MRFLFAFEFSQEFLSMLALCQTSLTSVQRDGLILCFEEFALEDNQLSCVLVCCLFSFEETQVILSTNSLNKQKSDLLKLVSSLCVLFSSFSLGSLITSSYDAWSEGCC